MGRFVQIFRNGDELLFLDYGNLYKFTVDNSGTDKITGSDDADEIIGVAANNDRIEGLNGDDSLYGVLGNDTLLGGNGNDILSGGDGSDSLIGQIGNDTLYGRNSNDILQGDRGNDTLYGGNGYDTLYGGSGSDIFAVRSGQTKDTIADFELGNDKLGLAYGIEFEDLTFEGNIIKLGEENLVQLNNINAESLSSSDFTELYN